MKAGKEKQLRFIIIIVLLAIGIVVYVKTKEWAGLLIWIAWVLFMAVSYQKRVKRQKQLDIYVQNFQLTPEKLGEITRFSRYDFSYDTNHQLVFGYGDFRRYQQLLEDLEQHFGKIEQFEVH